MCTVHVYRVQALKFMYSRLNSLMTTVQVVDMEEFDGIQLVCDFATLIATYAQGFMCVLEPVRNRHGREVRDPILQLACLDASLAIKPVFDRFQSVVITSGTLSPIDFYPKVLSFNPVVRRSLPMSIARQPIFPMVVSRGNDQGVISSRFEQRDDPSVIRNFGSLLIEMCRVVPDGMICFFTSYSYMEKLITTWHENGVINKVLKQKLLFIETTDIVETSVALGNFKRACDSGRGAVFFSVARGKVRRGEPTLCAVCGVRCAVFCV